MNYLRKNRVAFRPSVGDACLEDRLEMAILAGVPRTPSALVSTAQAGTGQQGTMSLQQIRQAFVQQFRAANRDLLQLIGNEITLAYRNGTPSAQQLADLNAQINGAVNATAFRLSSQAALLPNGSARLVPAIQNALLGSRTNGLLGPFRRSPSHRVPRVRSSRSRTPSGGNSTRWPRGTSTNWPGSSTRPA